MKLAGVAMKPALLTRTSGEIVRESKSFLTSLFEEMSAWWKLVVVFLKDASESAVDLSLASVRPTRMI